MLHLWLDPELHIRAASPALLLPCHCVTTHCLVPPALQDTKVVDNACTALSYIAEAFAGDAKRLELLNTHGLINQAIQLVRCAVLPRLCAAHSDACRLLHV